MKIALVITRQDQRNEITNFIQRSGLDAADCEIWHLAADPVITCDNQLKALEEKYRQAPVDMVLFASGSLGAERATRLAARLKGDAICGVSEGAFGRQPWVSKPVYGNAMAATLQPGEKPWCFSVAHVSQASYQFADIPMVELLPDAAPPTWLLEIQQLPETLCPALSSACVVVAVGQGVANHENIERIEQLASQMGAELGASRQVVMNAWCGMERLIGMSGHSIAPEICIVAGASGASAFTMGLRHSGFIVAINSDPQAAIFAQADVGIVDDLMPVLEALAQCTS